ncbi:MAG: imelysin family protein [Halothiobacillaceae bacterium]
MNTATRNKTTFRLATLTLACGLALGTSSVQGAPGGTDAESVLEHTATHVIARNYLRLADATERLAGQLTALDAQPVTENVIAARAAWRAARADWETSEAHLFGPVDTDGHDPAMDSWPIDLRELVGLIDGDAPLNAAAVDTLDGDIKGFHAIEYLLWQQPVDEGRESAEAAAARLADAPRQRALLVSLGADLNDHAEAMAAAWQGDDGYARQLAAAGTPDSRLYPAVAGAVQELAENMDIILDEVAAAKLGEPLESGRPDGVESPYARDTRADMHNNVTGIRNLWLGSLDGADSRLGLRALAAANGANVEAVDRALRVALGRIEAIGETPDASGQLAFAEVVADGQPSHKEQVSAAVDAVRDLQARLAAAFE